MATKQEYKKYRVNNLPTSGLSAGDTYVLNVGGGKYQTYVVSDTLQLTKEAGADFLEKDNVAELRVITAREIWAIQNGHYKGVKLNGYYEKGDTPTPIDYYISATSATDDGGSVFEVESVKFEHKFTQKDISARYFGVLNDSQINQSYSIMAFNKYCDDNNIYEIDFENMTLIAPTTTIATTPRGSNLKGFVYNKPHTVKNLNITIDKTSPIVHGQCGVLFMPEDLGNGEVFKVDNVTFDMYNSNYVLNTGEEDGFMHGFMFMNKSLYGGSINTLHNYHIIFKDVEFKSPCLSYNIKGHPRVKKVTVDNVVGQYLGLAYSMYADEHILDNLKGKYMSALKGSRVLVTTLIQDEQEVHNNVTINSKYRISNSECYTDTGVAHILYKIHNITNYNIDFEAVNCIGGVELYKNNNNAINFSKLYLTNCLLGNVNFLNHRASGTTGDIGAKIIDLVWDNVKTVNPQALIQLGQVTNANLKDCSFGTISNASAGTYIENLVIDNANNIGTNDSGIVRSTAGTGIKNITIKNTNNYAKPRIVECLTDKVRLENFIYNGAQSAIKLFLKKSGGDGVVNVEMNNVIVNSTLALYYELIDTYAGTTVNLDWKNVILANNTGSRFIKNTTIVKENFVYPPADITDLPLEADLPTVISKINSILTSRRAKGV